MEKLKKLFCVVAALAFMLAFQIPAFANGSITVVSNESSQYRAYKIFDASESNGNVTYYLAKNSEWASLLVNSQGGSNFNGLTFTEDPQNPDRYIVTWDRTVFSSADFAAFLSGSSYANISNDLNDANYKPSVGPFNSGIPVDLTPGYYLVLSSTDNFGSYENSASLATVLDSENVIIQNKNDAPFDKTVNGQKEDSVQIGDTVQFIINGEVPGGFGIYLVSDKMDDGLTFTAGSVNVMIDGETIALTTVTDTNVSLTGNQIRYAPYAADGKDFELSLDLSDKSPNDPIVIKYSAVVNEDASEKITENDAILRYGNDPSSLMEKTSQAKVYTSRLIIDKYVTDHINTKLPGVKFKLVKYASSSTGAALQNNGSRSDLTAYYYKGTFNAQDDLTHVEWVEENSGETEVTTDIYGRASFYGLEDGYYYLIETDPPFGYATAEPTEVHIDGSVANELGLSSMQINEALTTIANVENTPGADLLPSTGGSGTTVFYFAGFALVMGSAVAVIIRKRANA